MGRPILPAELRRSHRVSISYTPSEFDVICHDFNNSKIGDLARFIALASLDVELQEAEILPEVNAQFISELRLLRETTENLECLIEDQGSDSESLDYIRQLTVAIQSMANFVTNPHSYKE